MALSDLLDAGSVHQPSLFKKAVSDVQQGSEQ